MEYTLYWIWLSLCCTPGSNTYALLRRSFSSPREVFCAGEDEIRSALKENPTDLKSIIKKDTEKAKKVLDYCVRAKVKIVSYDSEEYPCGLREISNPPVLLYCLGDIPSDREHLFVSVVGTRKMSDYGKKMAFEISSDLTTAGVVVVSGLALGIDGTAHAAAMSAKGKTVAVLGSGIDCIYPATHNRLATFVANNGAVVTEFAPGTSPERWNFPLRNRIISGMSQATLVVEADEKSGALITGRRALEQGRKVYALPGNVDEENSQGINMIIKEGARPISCADDILDDFNSVYDGKVNIFNLLKKTNFAIDASIKKYGVYSRVYKNANAASPLHSKNAKKDEAQKSVETVKALDDTQIADPEIEKILSTLDENTVKVYSKIPYGEGIYMDDISCDDGITDVATALTLLEVSDLVEFLPGNKVAKKRK